MITTTPPLLATADLVRVVAAIDLLGANDTASVLATALPSLDEEHRTALAGHVTIDHVALLIFPETLDGLVEELAAQGIRVGGMTPSVVVRDRLSVRYDVPPHELEVGILRSTVTDRVGRPCELEIFAVVTPPRWAHIAEDERRHSREAHFALAVRRADAVLLRGLRATIAAAMRPDGGGYNGAEDRTVLYFRDAHGADPAFRRLELFCTGRLTRLLATHQRESCAGTELLRLLTGAWATQAIATAAELRLLDHVETTPDLPDLAAATGTDQHSLARLLRYLAALGVVHAAGTRYGVTELGALLRSEAAGSMRPLALMYGGPFYRSFAAFTEAVRSGGESYAKVFGSHHFEHMAADPELAELFHRSMAAGNAVFAGVPGVFDFSAARTVVDVAGGNGELLSRVLHANPALRGVLMERPHALTAARTRLADVADRVTLVPGDFTESVPGGGDVYLLSRVLHDWDDERCRTILAACARTMPEHAELLVVERLLPESGDVDSLAIPWDIHMLCNTGGRERTGAHYRDLLAGAGFEVVETHPLPLDAHLVRCRRFRTAER
ncbi:methyltransferase [Umezawaea endophytica]|uniref:Acetylserotonin O-methyltransferase n=1 Tax=Umezawaea endophytica TaxID=1654476 RepID=A0A9X2VKU3_9PSEU|nr:acetylserotonin O-methyltransferase [Umezawaea endophytica]MCS7477907.1 acetylserotonin O-methyltransferase [Umezawaea endophytica]